MPVVNQPSGLYAYKLKLTRLPLAEILSNAQKLISTKAHTLVRHEVDDFALLSAVEALKAKSNWSLLQPKKFNYKRSKCHYDHLLDGIHLLAIDFHQERNWKISCAYYFALQCSQHPYHLNKLSNFHADQSSSETEKRKGKHKLQHLVDNVPLTIQCDSENIPTLTLSDSTFIPSETVDSLHMVPIYDFTTADYYQNYNFHSLATAANKRPKIAKVLNDERLYFAALESIIKAEIMKSTIVPPHPPNLQVLLLCVCFR